MGKFVAISDKQREKYHGSSMKAHTSVYLPYMRIPPNYKGGNYRLIPGCGNGRPLSKADGWVRIPTTSFNPAKVLMQTGKPIGGVGDDIDCGATSLEMFTHTMTYEGAVAICWIVRSNFSWIDTKVVSFTLDISYETTVAREQVIK